MDTAQAVAVVKKSTAPDVEEVEATADRSGARLQHIATAAYFKAEARGFQPGKELDDWLEAEAEFDGWKQ